jgi:hypothetical protein
MGRFIPAGSDRRGRAVRLAVPAGADVPAEAAPVERARLWWLLELFALTGLVVAQPLLDVIGRSPDFFLFRKADSRDIALLVVAITLVPPLVLWALELLASPAPVLFLALFLTSCRSLPGSRTTCSPCWAAPTTTRCGCSRA